MRIGVEPETSQEEGDWDRSGVFEVSSGVYRVVLPLPQDGLRAVNVYVLEAHGRLTIIDSGWSIPEARELLLAAVSTLEATPSDIDRFLNDSGQLGMGGGQKWEADADLRVGNAGFL